MLFADSHNASIASATTSFAVFFGRIRHLEFKDNLLALFRIRILLFGVSLQYLRPALGNGLARDILDENVFGLGCFLFLRSLRCVFEGHICKYSPKGKPLLIVHVGYQEGLKQSTNYITDW